MNDLVNTELTYLNFHSQLACCLISVHFRKQLYKLNVLIWDGGSFCTLLSLVTSQSRWQACSHHVTVQYHNALSPYASCTTCQQSCIPRPCDMSLLIQKHCYNIVNMLIFMACWHSVYCHTGMTLIAYTQDMFSKLYDVQKVTLKPLCALNSSVVLLSTSALLWNKIMQRPVSSINLLQT